MRSIAVIPRGFTPEGGRFAQIVHAVNLQVNKDFAPAWNIVASVGYFPRIEDAPADSSFVIVSREVKGNGGSHFRPCKTEEPPFALVTYDDHEAWSVLLSHEVLEMLVDPGCNYFVDGPDPENGSRKAKFLVEICDPCMGRTYINDEAPKISVADFCLPAYYGLKAGNRFTHRDTIHVAYTVARGGYLSWQNADGVWRQANAIGGSTVFESIGADVIADAIAACNFRGTLDRRHGNYGGAAVSGESRPATNRRQAGDVNEHKRNARRIKALDDALSSLRI
ncbi:hypothetical protein [Massilia antarctica]|uniref:hypothetical protein n=1 Tax=Massilia antarctica TaxID=2765360 RepID=UPI0035EF9197